MGYEIGPIVTSAYTALANIIAYPAAITVNNILPNQRLLDHLCIVERVNNYSKKHFESVLTEYNLLSTASVEALGAKAVDTAMAKAKQKFEKSKADNNNKKKGSN